MFASLLQVRDGSKRIPIAALRPSIILTFTFFRGDLRTSLTLDVGEDDTSKPSDQCEHENRVFLCAGMAGAILAVYYESKGYKRKASDCWITLGVSVAFHLVAGIFLYAQR